MTQTSRKHLTLIDASGFIFRAFHALPPLTRADGTPVGAVMGFANMLMRLLLERKPEHLAVVFDVSRKTFRTELYPEYKAHRPPTPPELIPQFALVRELVAAFSLAAVEAEGYEADDLLATYARLGHEKGMDVSIVSSDKDLMQLVGDGVTMLDPIRYRPIGPAEVMEKFGVPPDKVGDLLALMGDASDNVPGVPGIGPKTAAQLITEFGSLDSLLAQLDSLPESKRKQNLIENVELARLSKKLVTLEDHAPEPLPLSALVVPELDKARLAAFFKAQGFKSLLAKLGPVVGGDERFGETVETSSASPIKTVYEKVDTLPALRAWIGRIHDKGVVAVDTETTSLTPCVAGLVGVSLSVAPGHACYIPLGHVAPGGGGQFDFGETPAVLQLREADALALLKPVLEDPAILKVGHNIKFDMQVFAARGIDVAPIDDTMLISYVLDGRQHGQGMDELARLHLGHDCISYKEVTKSGRGQMPFAEVAVDAATAYAAEDADITLRLWQHLKPRLLPAHQVALYEQVDRPLVPVVAAMETAGICVDVQALADLSQSLAQRMADLEAEIHRLAGHGFNVGSPQQLGAVLFDEMGLAGGKRSANGSWSTDVAVLEPLAEEGTTIVERVLEWRQAAKLKSTYTDALPRQIDPKTGRIHTSFSLAATNTGRLASTDPNLQNIPVRSEEGKKIRAAFIAPPGHVLISADYSQVELRLLSEMAGIPALKQAFLDGVDIHALTASQVFGVPLADMTPDLRRHAKAINFGIVYGISAFGLARQLGIEPSAAGAYIRTYLERFPELAAYMEGLKEFARAHGYVETIFGRKCFMPEITSKNPNRRHAAERQAINAPIQGTAADLMKKAMIAVHVLLRDSGLPARVLLQVHDELVVESRGDVAGEVAALVKKGMEGISIFSVPLVAEAGIGCNWAVAK
ncbi:MAG TPA: DNA polymerase I [Rhodospirillaceae bacterium]|nr:MAG: DNA polymerase I [Alphaproteobacteria bacterium GWF2_58_20]HAU28614.1 DNA polymerase I [Rhodospirillaceae bacterium]